MTALSSFLNESLIRDLREQIRRGKFPGISFEQAMSFLLTDGILPATGLPAQSFLSLEDWVREYGTVSFTATELKNKTGEVLEAVSAGKTVRLTKHGRAFAEIRKLG